MRANLPVSTTVPAATAALVTAFSTISGINVKNGPGKGVFTKDDVLLVGIPDASGEAIRHNWRQDHSGVRVDESYDIICMIGSWNGNDDVQARQVRCAEILTAARAALRTAEHATNGALGGVVDIARIGDRLSWLPQADSEGVMYTVGFSVHITAAI